MKKLLSIFATLLLTTACSVTEVVRGPVVPADSIVTIEVAPAATILAVGEQQQFVAIAKNMIGAEIPDKQFVWTSTVPTVASVNATGRVTGIGAGTATIQATSGGVTGQSPVAVAITPVSVIILAPSSAQVFLGQTITPGVELRGPNSQLLTNRFVEWTSLNTSVATVNQLGVITAVGVGTATIRATSEGKTANFTLTVNTRPAASVAIVPPTAIHVGRNTPLELQVRDSQGQLLPLTGRTIRWSADNSGVATITSTGVVRGIAPGSISIAALVDDQLAVLNTAVTTVDIDTLLVTLADNTDSPADTVPVRVGFTRQFIASPRDANNLVIDNAAMAGRTITWATETPNLIAVSNTGLVTGIASGNAILRASVNGVVTRKRLLVVF